MTTVCRPYQASLTSCLQVESIPDNRTEQQLRYVANLVGGLVSHSTATQASYAHGQPEAAYMDRSYHTRCWRQHWAKAGHR